MGRYTWLFSFSNAVNIISVIRLSSLFKQPKYAFVFHHFFFCPFFGLLKIFMKSRKRGALVLEFGMDSKINEENET